jgi:hypothetical protein
MHDDPQGSGATALGNFQHICLWCDSWGSIPKEMTVLITMFVIALEASKFKFVF